MRRNNFSMVYSPSEQIDLIIEEGQQWAEQNYVSDALQAAIDSLASGWNYVQSYMQFAKDLESDLRWYRTKLSKEDFDDYRFHFVDPILDVLR